MRVVKSEKPKKSSAGSLFSSKLEAAMNEQLNREFYSVFLYLSMAAHFSASKLPGFAHWMRLQADEENAHAMKFYDFIIDRDARVQVKKIDGPPTTFGSPLVVFEQALEHEREIRDHIHRLYEQADAAKDHGTVTFLHWFVSEQVEEEKILTGIIDKLSLVGEDTTALYMIDRELATRAPAPESGP